MQYVVLIGRIFFSLIFVLSGQVHFSHNALEYALTKGVIFAPVLVPFSGIMAIIGGISIILGYKARWGALLIVLFLVPVTLVMHNFWALSDPMAARLQHTMFMKNLSMLGGALIITYFGSGPMSLDAWLKNRKTRK
jgi:putative oxidoreductase